MLALFLLLLVLYPLITSSTSSPPSQNQDLPPLASHLRSVLAAPRSRPLTVLSWAQTPTGSVCFHPSSAKDDAHTSAGAGADVEARREVRQPLPNVALSCPESFEITHTLLRSLADYICVGSGTLLVDDPRLLPHGRSGGGLKPVVLCRSGWSEVSEKWEGLKLHRRWDGAVVFKSGEGSVIREEGAGGGHRYICEGEELALCCRLGRLIYARGKERGLGVCRGEGQFAGGVFCLV